MAAVVVAVWFPYLSFETGRGFADLRSLMLLQDINPANYQAAWCDPSLSLRILAPPGGESQADVSAAPPQQSSLSLPQRVMRRAGAIVDGLLATFRESVQLPGLAPLLLMAALAGAVAAWTSRTRRERLLVVSLAIPWAVLALLAEPGKVERFLWLWPLQIIIVAAFAIRIAARLPRSWPITWVPPLVLVCALVADPLRVRLDAWQQTGWAGTDAEEVQVADYAAALVKAEGREQVAIGYETFVYPFMARYHAIDPHYKVGAEFDLLLKYRHGIINVNQCAEGVALGDDFRIVQKQPQTASGAPNQYFAVQRDPAFRPLGSVATYEIRGR